MKLNEFFLCPRLGNPVMNRTPSPDVHAVKKLLLFLAGNKRVCNVAIFSTSVSRKTRRWKFAHKFAHSSGTQKLAIHYTHTNKLIDRNRTPQTHASLSLSFKPYNPNSKEIAKKSAKYRFKCHTRFWRMFRSLIKSKLSLEVPFFDASIYSRCVINVSSCLDK